MPNTASDIMKLGTVTRLWKGVSTWSGLIPREIRQEGLVLEQHVREGRFQRALAFVAAMASLMSGLEVTYEHYRGSYSQQIMYTPVVLSVALTVVGVWAVFNRWVARVLLPILSVLVIVDGCVGFIFHIRGVARKPGGWRVPVMNVIMGPPVFAPLLFGLSGYLGLLASFLRREGDSGQRLAPGLPQSLPVSLSFLPRRITRGGITWEQELREGRFQRHVAVVAGVSGLLSGLEALYSHYENNFLYPKLQWSPLILSPLMLIAGLGTIWSRSVARILLPIASALALLDGGIGFFYHARGALRRPGGARLPLYNLIYGPPVFAPLLFAASGFLGILASLFRREKA